ncbi:cysteine-rich motor neuron 1 protein-like isoform X3 [Zootermopsis nevadensis]|uniref:cysteine-rich motor neuron 1 protein-like isoform X3 n=1 Tax=Zootermopsis nevadensis TaxID=136037 RepID=UPI000B8EE886|nr:cysteine-rich motor neuron 1 protein-like isoform X3 [Zootermopsis nevadensis]
MLISMKTSGGICVAVAILLFVNTRSASTAVDYGAKCNSTADCAELLMDDEALCPPDSAPSDPSVPGNRCQCAPARCVQPLCRFGATRVLLRTGTTTPGDCCDVYECVQPKDKNCSEVICPDEGVDCPTDSYRLPNLRAPGDCCSHPQGCECLPGPCPEPDCSDGEHARVVRQGNQKPGTCCPLYKCVEHELNDTCVFDGDVWKNGSTWWKNECTQCSCNNGLSFCAERTSQCPELPSSCRVTQVPQGKCCPVCVEADPVAENSLILSGGCVSSTGELHQNGEDWQEDPCTTCTCVAGAKKCQAHMCVLRCDHPRYVPDECCPLCDATSVVTIPPHCPALNNCSLRCLHGFVRDNNGCYSCRCQADECVLECPNGYLQDSHGNKLCECSAECPALSDCHKNCSHGFRLNKAGCEVCKCKECRPLMDCNKNCVHGLRTNDRGCPICKCKASSEHIPEVTTSNHIITETSCISAGELHHDDGEVWFDGCRQCYCHGGVEMCNLITCPVPACKQPVLNVSRDCCPRCPDTGYNEHKPKKLQQAMVCHSVDGVYRVEGETWPLDACTQCLCHLGRVLCKTHHCPPAPCLKPVYQAGQCCPMCADFAPVSSPGHAKSCNAHHLHGTAWMEDSCRSCACVNGHVSCFTQQCTNITCSRPVLAKNQCCPICLDRSSPKTCSVGNVTYHEGENWHEDACTRCQCSSGQKMCTQKVCSVSCINPVKKPGKCCPVCTEADSTRNHGDSVPSSEVAPLGFFTESVYITIILVLVCVIICFAFYFGYQYCCHRQQLKLDSTPKSCPNPAYHGYVHRDSCAPPQYTSGDCHRSNVDPYQYEYVPAYDCQ